MRSLGRQELSDIVLGATLIGAGGGGSFVEGTKLVDKVLEFGSAVQLVEPNEVDDEAWGAVLAGMGSPVASMSRVRIHSPERSLAILEETVGFKSDFVIPFEVGAGNSLNPMLAAVQRGIPVVDGDPVGRAVPEVQMTTFYLAGMHLSPFILAGEEGISAIIRTEKPYDCERVARAITSELGGVSSVALHAMQGKPMKEHIIHGTTTWIEEVGRAIREARSAGKDAAEVLISSLDGYLLGKGTVTRMASETRGGFDFGAVEVEGELPVRVDFQNENMLAWRGKKLLAMVPDLICCIDAQGQPLTNADVKEGLQVSYVGFAAKPPFRTPEAVHLFDHILKVLGYEEGFVPIEELNA
jgi:hypothetical protein